MGIYDSSEIINPPEDEYTVNPQPVKLITNKTDYDIAQELKQEMVEASKATCAVMDKAIKLGFQIQTTFDKNHITGKYNIVQCVVSKVF